MTETPTFGIFHRARSTLPTASAPPSVTVAPAAVFMVDPQPEPETSRPPPPVLVAPPARVLAPRPVRDAPGSPPGFIPAPVPPPPRDAHAADPAAASETPDRKAHGVVQAESEPKFPRYGQAQADPPFRPAAAEQAFGVQRLKADSVAADQLGLVNPASIKLCARLPDAVGIELDASASGLYRPLDFRAAPWSGFAYDHADNAAIGWRRRPIPPDARSCRGRTCWRGGSSRASRIKGARSARALGHAATPSQSTAAG